VIAVLDLDGDGKMEVVVASQYYEGAATTIYRCDPKKIEDYFLSNVECKAMTVPRLDHARSNCRHSVSMKERRAY
jgi:hypothetical protein